MIRHSLRTCTCPPWIVVHFFRHKPRLDREWVGIKLQFFSCTQERSDRTTSKHLHMRQITHYGICPINLEETSNFDKTFLREKWRLGFVLPNKTISKRYIWLTDTKNKTTLIVRYLSKEGIVAQLGYHVLKPPKHPYEVIKSFKDPRQGNTKHYMFTLGGTKNITGYESCTK